MSNGGTSTHTPPPEGCPWYKLSGGRTDSIYQNCQHQNLRPASALEESSLQVRLTGVQPAGCLLPAPSVTAKGWTQVLCPPAGGGSAKQETGGHPGKWLLSRGVRTD